MVILQMLIGVLCEVVNSVGQERRDAADIDLVKRELLSSLNECDDGDGKINGQELMRVMQHKRSREVLHKLNINELFLLQLQKIMFPTPTSEVTIKSVLDLLVICRGSCNATVQTLAGGFAFMEAQ